MNTTDTEENAVETCAPSAPAANACASLETSTVAPQTEQITSNEIQEQEKNQSPPLCKHWAKSKTCLYHDKGKCKFDHPPDYEIPPKTQRRRHRSSGGWGQTRNDARVAILRSFLAEELARNGIPDLSSFRVLDVAGGKGELAFQLLNLNNVSTCHVIDPRPLSLKKFQKRLSKGFYHRSQGILRHDVVRPRTEPERPVDQLRCFFSSELWEEEETKEDRYEKQREQFFQNCYKARGWVWPPPEKYNEHASCGKNYEDRDDIPTKAEKAIPDGSNLGSIPLDNLTLGDTAASSLGIDFDSASSVVKTADLVVGMHPDQAVDAIVDLALYQNISFFVVPCCVFAREFPHRRVRVAIDGSDATNKPENDEETSSADRNESTMKPVTTYEELIDYLQAKSPDIKQRVLPFEGRNICLYRVVPPKKLQEEKDD